MAQLRIALNIIIVNHRRTALGQRLSRQVLAESAGRGRGLLKSVAQSRILSPRPTADLRRATSGLKGIAPLRHFMSEATKNSLEQLRHFNRPKRQV